MEAAVAYYQATGKKRFLDLMCKYADYIEKRFKIDRDTDFGMIRKKDGSPISNKPTLFKSGAHKILTAYGLTYLTELTDKKVDLESGLFYFEFKATAYFNGQPVRTGWGCANTNEKSTGFASSWDVANSKMKRKIFLFQ